MPSSSIPPNTTTLESMLERSNAHLGNALAALGSQDRIDISGLPASAAALLLARLAEVDERKLLILTADSDAARSMAADLALFSGSAVSEAQSSDRTQMLKQGTEQEKKGRRTPPPLVYPTFEQSPFVEVAPNRRASMERLATLFHLASGQDWRFAVTPMSALLRRVPPRKALVERSMVIEAEEELDRDALVRILVEGGYLRVPLVEDPGTFAVRGSLIDIFPPHCPQPVRIELDDWLVLSIRHFDADDQRKLQALRKVSIHPVREAIYGDSEIALARMRLRDLCDEIDLPTRKTHDLLDNLESGRLQAGIDGFLPAFYPQLERLSDYLPKDLLTVVIDPSKTIAAARAHLKSASRDHDARVSDHKPVFDLGDLYCDEESLWQELSEGPIACVHRLAMVGAAAEEDGALGTLEVADPDRLLRLGAEDQVPLSAELKSRRQTHGKQDALLPLARHTRAWLDAGMRVILTARTRTQAERLGALLRGYDVPLAGLPCTFSLALLQGTGKQGPAEHGAVVSIGDLSAGFALGSEALVLITEEEVFGTRAHRRKSRAKGKALQPGRAFIEDLRQLQVGDFVVHADHGVGRYLGLERRSVGLSRHEEMQGLSSTQMEVLIIEYTKGDRLFLPVTRLHQLQKHSGGEGHKPKIDRLGGQTFSNTKARVHKRVREMADELLRLYAERAARTRPPLPPTGRTYAEFEATFPFEETADQAQAIDDVLSDLVQERPMDRIVCGDVGFGKTEVAIRAAFRVAMEGRQVAILCPTTVLAQQHFLTFKGRLEDYPLRIEVLSRFVDRKKQTEIMAAARKGKVDILIGTHRLLSKDIHFADLGLLVVDEEQRFGVAHKERIKKLKTEVDVLTLTATPIPRTLQLAVGGLRDLSLITTAPVDRRAVRTLVARWDDHMIREAILREVGRGGQAFFVFNRIEGLYERAQKLQLLMPDVRFAVAHGQMGETALEQTMTDFIDGNYDVLCSTAIIESGLDIPRANTMIIDGANFFGLAQLYQLRGRVGRSKERAYCYLLTPPPDKMTDDARARIEALERFSHLGAGFSVASLDMELRGAGDVLGGEQSGSVSAVGFELFMRMLREAVAELRGQPVVHEVDTELTLDVDLYIPDDYVEDVGLRLSFYKRLSAAIDEDEVVDLAAEMEDRFGPPPSPTRDLVRAMRMRPAMRALRVLGCEAGKQRITLHLRPDTPLDPAKVMRVVQMPQSPWKLTADMKLSRRYDEHEPEGSLERMESLLKELSGFRVD